MRRIKICRWYLDQQLRIYHPAGVNKTVIRYTPSIDYEDLAWCDRRKSELGVEGTDDIAKIALYAGAYSRLWIGPLDGTIAPMDVQPEGWTYASGDPLEPSWWWQWYPSDTARKLIMGDLSERNPLEVKTFKHIAPIQLQKESGPLTDVQAIDVIRLPGLFKNGVPFIFETDL